MDSEMAGTLKVTLRKSEIGSTRKIRATLVGLGLTKREKTVIRKDTPEIRGMLRKVDHLVTVEEV
jgi:large subunit ribosomal protein L30